MHPHVRLAAPADIVLLRTMEDEYYEFDRLTIDPGLASKALAALLSDETLGRVWLLFDGAAPAGYLILCFGYSIEFGGRNAFIDELYLREPYRGRGWGRFAMEFAISAAAETGVGALHLEVTRENSRALALYESLGFVDHDRFLMTKRD